ncbi:MAG: undecaprenyl-diphosphate phosphatase [bacterium]
MELLTPTKAIILGLVQGITEFLPVSSSAHLALAQNLLGAKEIPLVFDIFLHLATLFAVLMVLDKKVIAILKNPMANAKTIKIVASATAITAVLGYLLASKISLFFSNLTLVGILLLINSLILAINHPKFPKISLTKGRGIWLGLAQSLALIPGISRSGTTITTARASGFKPQEAFEISFLLYLPAVAGALVLESVRAPLAFYQVNAVPIAVGFFTAFISGWGTLKVLQSILQKGKLWIFAPYCIVLGLLLLFF